MAKKCWVDVDNLDGSLAFSDCLWNADCCTYAEDLIAEDKTKNECKHWREEKEVKSMKVEKYEEIKLLMNIEDAKLVKACVDICRKKTTEPGCINLILDAIDALSARRDELKGLSDAMQMMGVE